MRTSFRARDEIQSLDPVRDHCRIFRLFAKFEFPWEVQRGMDLALFRSLCVPSISKVLSQSGELLRCPQKRYDDTAVLMTELAEHGYDSPRGREIVERLERIHARYVIPNDELKYVLSTYLFEPIRWIDRFGWRHTTLHEQQACFHFYRELGVRLGIRELPASYADFERFNRAFEQTRFEYAASNRQLAEATRALFLSWFPVPVRPLILIGLSSVMDDAMLDAYGFAHPPRAVRSLVRAALRLKRFRPAGTLRSYPHGYTLELIGPPDLLEEEALSREAEALRNAVTDEEVAESLACPLPVADLTPNELKPGSPRAI